jgi:ribonuclease P protein component
MVSLTRNKDFRTLYARGKQSAGVYLVVYSRPNRRESIRLGLTVSTKLGNAVIRNRIRRRLREAIRLQEHRFRKGIDIVVVARAKALNAPFPALQQELVRMSEKMNLLT